MWTKNKLWKLRQEIALGSLYTRDYDNSFGVNERACQDFFDSYLDWLAEEMQEEGISDSDFWDELDNYDNAENLYEWYMMYEDEPLVIED